MSGRRVTDVEVEGESSGATGARDVGIEVGTLLTRHALRETIARLLEDGRWADVQIDAVADGPGVRLIVRLAPRIVITRTDVIDNSALSDEDVRAALGLGAGGELQEQELDELASRVRDTYRERGYVYAQVLLRLRDTDDPSRKVLRVVLVEGEPMRLRRFVFPGDAPPRRFDLADALGIHEGDPLDQTRFVEGVPEIARRLRNAGYLEAQIGTPEVVRDGHVADLRVHLDLGPHYVVRIIGHEPLERGTVETVLDLESNRLTPRSLSELEIRVRELYERHGYRQAQVRVERIAVQRARGELALEIQVAPGRQLHVVGMSFPGARHFEPEYLRSQVISVLEEDLPDTRMFAAVDTDTVDRLGLGGQSEVRRRRIPRPLEVDPSRVYYAPLYERAVEHLREVYEAAGYLAARVGPVRLDAVGRGRAVVAIPVLEGPRTLLFGVSLHGNAGIGDRALLEAANLRRSDPFSYLGLEEALQRMTELYQEQGYLYARIEPTVRFSENRTRAEVVLNVIERFQVRFGEITIEGARRTSEDLIRDVLRITPGEIFRPSLVNASQEALLGLGIFNSAHITPRDQTLPERVKPIVVRVTERLPQHFEFQLGISTGQGLRSSLEYGFLNLGGYALQVTGRAQLGLQFFFQDPELRRNISGLPLQDRLERRVTITLALPHISGLDNVRSTLDLVHLRDNQRVFGLDENGLVLSFNWHPFSRLAFTLSAEVENNNVQLFGDRQSIREILEGPLGMNQQIVQLLRVPEGNSVVVSTELSAALDQRDSSFVPTEGWFAAASVEWVRTLDTEEQEDGEPFFSHFMKLGATLNGYIPFDEVVLAGQFRIGGIIPLEAGSETYPNRQFFLGGVDTLRGFNQNQLQPQDIAELQLSDPTARTNTVLQGGDFFYLLRTELRFPLFAAFEGGIFIEAGNHWARTENIFGSSCPPGVSAEACFPLRPMAGIGLRIATPVGPLAVDYGFNLLRREELNEPWGAFHFYISVF